MLPKLLVESGGTTLKEKGEECEPAFVINASASASCCVKRWLNGNSRIQEYLDPGLE
jgi:hypothetical protein